MIKAQEKKEQVRTKLTFSPKIQPLGSLYWGASWEAYRLPITRRGIWKARIDSEGGITALVKSDGQLEVESDYLSDSI